MRPWNAVFAYGILGWLVTVPVHIYQQNWSGIMVSFFILLPLLLLASLVVLRAHLVADKADRIGAEPPRMRPEDFTVGAIVGMPSMGSRWRGVIVPIKHEEHPGKEKAGYVEIRDDEGVPVAPGTRKLVGACLDPEAFVLKDGRWRSQLPVFEINDYYVISDEGDILVG